MKQGIQEDLLENYEDLDSSHESKGATPGPGYYLDNTKTTTFKPKEVPINQ